MEEPTIATVSTEIRSLGQAFQHFVENDFKAVKERVEKFEPVLDAYDSVIFSKKFIVGLGSIIGSIAAVGAGILWLVDELIKHN